MRTVTVDEEPSDGMFHKMWRPKMQASLKENARHAQGGVSMYSSDTHSKDDTRKKRRVSLRIKWLKGVKRPRSEF